MNTNLTSSISILPQKTQKELSNKPLFLASDVIEKVPDKTQNYRYFIHLAYNGTLYHGWQIQPHHKTIQEIISQSINIVLKTNINLVGAGRTDSGVHAKNYYAHFDVIQPLQNLEKLIVKLNNFLPKDIVIYNIFAVDNDKHARFDAIERTYKYYIACNKNPFTYPFSYKIDYKVNVNLMNLGCDILVKTKNFQSFSKVHTQVNNYICEIYHAQWFYEKDLLIFEIIANRFLRNMVRAIVGTLLDLGREKISLTDLKHIIETQNRSAAGTSVPANALFLENIRYNFNLNSSL